MWPAVLYSHSPSAHFITAVQPVLSNNVNINTFGNLESSIMAVEYIQCHQVQADLPQIPPPWPASAPAPPPTPMLSMPALVPPYQIPTPIGPTSNNPTLPALAPAPILTPAPAPAPAPTLTPAPALVAISHRVKADVPNKVNRKNMITHTIAPMIQSAMDNAVAKPPKEIEHEMHETMCKGIQPLHSSWAAPEWLLAALHDFEKDVYNPHSLDRETWQGYYKEIMLKVKSMWEDLTLALWLHSF
ncbi:hypothetical protein HD554DRAFT_2035472 [Boletus coccyginus]|nr:hypothetical protein HD554DRAFT_2035472 [Boletus coccyginus]